MREQVLCCWPDPADPVCAAARRALLPLKLRVRAVSATQGANRAVGALLGLREFAQEASEGQGGSAGAEASGEAPAVADPIILMDGLTGARMDAVLRALARAGVPRTVFKAAATAHNVNWTLFQLWEELKREREALDRGDPAAHQ